MGVCLLERLQHEPYWDNVPVEPITGSCRAGTGTLSSQAEALEAMRWPSLRQYVQPLAYVDYTDARDLDRISWKFPSWRAEGPLHETMTLSDGFNTLWRALQETLRSHPCGLECAAAVLLGETMQFTREALARPGQRLPPPLREAFCRAPWRAWLKSGWAWPLLEALAAASAAEAAEAASALEAACVGQLQELLTDCEAVQQLPAALCGCLDARPMLRLAAACLAPRPIFLGGTERRLSHTLCDLVSQQLDDTVALHVHGASAYLQEDAEGRPWLRLEVLHFLSTLDGAARLTVYGHLARDRKYYAQALTLPLGLMKKWRCTLDGHTEDARLTSFFGYDAILYCDIPLGDTLASHLEPAVSTGAWAARVTLCPRPTRRFRLAACTQPLHSFAKMEQLAPGLLADFLDYHALLGVEHFTIFDADGTLRDPLERYRERSSTEFEYLNHWPQRFGAAHAPVGAENWRPLLFEVEAENHCLWRYRGVADWAVVLHSPDEFLHVPSAPGPGSLLQFLEPLEEERARISHVELRQLLFGGAAEPSARTMPGRFRFREEGSDAAESVAHTVIVNVDNVAQAGVHPARPRPGENLRVVRADVMTDLRVNHYVNALGQERCGRRLCRVLDEGAAFAMSVLLLLAGLLGTAHAQCQAGIVTNTLAADNPLCFGNCSGLCSALDSTIMSFLGNGGVVNETARVVCQDSSELGCAPSAMPLLTGVPHS
ncbi:unnamed protein product [Effrenium voratum]|nr:unnamed protein product [Effrenium voratum]